MLEYNFLFQDNTTYAIKGSWHFITIKLTNVLVAHRTVVVALVLVQAEVKLSSMLNHRNIQRTQEHMILIVQFGEPARQVIRDTCGYYSLQSLSTNMHPSDLFSTTP